MSVFTIPHRSLLRDENYDYLSAHAEAGRVLEFRPLRDPSRNRAGMGVSVPLWESTADSLKFAGEQQTNGHDSLSAPLTSPAIQTRRRPDGTYDNGSEKKYWNWPLLSCFGFWLAVGALIYFAKK